MTLEEDTFMHGQVANVVVDDAGYYWLPSTIAIEKHSNIWSPQATLMTQESSSHANDQL